LRQIRSQGFFFEAGLQGVGLQEKDERAFRKKTMDRQLDTWRREKGERRWLSLLVDAMEQAARPEVRARVPEAVILNALRVQLTRPPACYSYVASGTRH
jgi:hypothetical protein